MIIREKLVSLWTASCRGCVLILYLSLGLLQIGDIIGNIYTRTSVLSAFVCAGIGLVTGVGFIYADGYLKTDAFRKRWVEASQDSDAAHTDTNSSTNDFWVCLTTPISLLAWSIFYFIATIITIICVIENPILQADINRQGGAGSPQALSPLAVKPRGVIADRPGVSGVYWISSVAFLLTLIAATLVQVYRAARLVLG